MTKQERDRDLDRLYLVGANLATLAWANTPDEELSSDHWALRKTFLANIENLRVPESIRGDIVRYLDRHHTRWELVDQLAVAKKPRRIESFEEEEPRDASRAEASAFDIFALYFEQARGRHATSAFRLGFAVSSAVMMARAAEFERKTGLSRSEVEQALEVVEDQLGKSVEVARELGLKAALELDSLVRAARAARTQDEIERVRVRIEKTAERIVVELEVVMRKPTSKDPIVAIIRAVFVLSLVAFVGGIGVAVVGRSGDTKISIFGQEASSTSVGVILAFLGAVVAIMLFKRVMDSLDRDRSEK